MTTQGSDATQGALPQLSPAQFRRLQTYGAEQLVAVGDTVFQAGDTSVDLILVDEGAIDIVRPATADAPEETIIRHGAGRFLGELNMLNDQRIYLTGRVVEAGRIHRVSPAGFRAVMDEEPEISDVLLRTFLARRELLREGPAARSVEIVGSAMSSSALALRTYAARQRLPHLWFDVRHPGRSPRSCRRRPATLAGPACGRRPRQLLRQATPGELAEQLGLSYRRADDNARRPRGRRCRSGRSRGRDVRRVGRPRDRAARRASGRAARRPRARGSRTTSGFPSGVSGADLTGKRRRPGAEVRRPALEPVRGHSAGHRRASSCGHARRRHRHRAPAR